jgi:hypothetical protein
MAPVQLCNKEVKMNGFRFSIAVIALVVAVVAIVLDLVNSFVLCGKLAFCTAVVRFPDGVNVVKNESFEQGDFNPDPRKGFQSLPVGSKAISDWEVFGTNRGQDVGWIQNMNALANNQAITTPFGNLFLNLSGNKHVADKGFFAGVRQTLPTVPGQPYQLSFFVGTNEPDFKGPAKADATLCDGQQSCDGQPSIGHKECDFTATTQGPQWTPIGFCSTHFVAKSGSTTLEIKGVFVPNGNQFQNLYIGLDEVDVECLAPLGNHDDCK